MKELFDFERFGIYFGIACAVWVGICMLLTVLKKQHGYRVAAAGGAVAYLLWLGYRALPADPKQVGTVLFLAGAFVFVGAMFGAIRR